MGRTMTDNVRVRVLPYETVRAEFWRGEHSCKIFAAQTDNQTPIKHERRRSMYEFELVLWVDVHHQQMNKKTIHSPPISRRHSQPQPSTYQQYIVCARGSKYARYRLSMDIYRLS